MQLANRRNAITFQIARGCCLSRTVFSYENESISLEAFMLRCGKLVGIAPFFRLYADCFKQFEFGA